jgi:hypothetical protein
MANKHLVFHPVKLALAIAIVSTVCTFLIMVAGIFGVMGGFPLWNLLILDIYGAILTNNVWVNAILSSVYAGADCFVFTLLVAWLYNHLL